LGIHALWLLLRADVLNPPGPTGRASIAGGSP